MAAISRHIRRLRAARHMTQEDLAQRLFVTRQAVSAWETGRALPDLETLERIAAALDADVLEVLYGAPRPAGTATRRRWMLLGAAWAAALAVLLALLEGAGVLGTWRNGLEYQFWDQGYQVAYEPVPGAYPLELDLSDPAGNVGKVLYDDGAGCRITVGSLEPADGPLGEFRVVFRAEGTCTPGGGALVSGCCDWQLDKYARSLESSATAAVTLGGRRLAHCAGGGLSSLQKNGNTFGFYVFPPDAYRGRDFALADDLAAAEGRVTLTVSGLTRMTTRRDSGLARFFRTL